MNLTLTYWIAIAAAGFLAALGSSIAGWNYYRGLRRSYPAQAASYWPEIVRDQLLVVGLSCNLLVGLLALQSVWARSLMALVAVLGGASCLSIFAIFNFLLRTGR